MSPKSLIKMLQTKPQNCDQTDTEKQLTKNTYISYAIVRGNWLLAALKLPDGTASLSFSNAGADASLLRAAIAQQYQDALNDIGIDTAQLALSSAVDNTPEKPIVTFSAQESCKALFAIMADQDRFATESLRFMGATVVHAAAGLERGTVPRSLRAMGIDRQALQKAAEHIIVTRSAAA